MIYIVTHVPEEGPGLFGELLSADAVTLAAPECAFPSVTGEDIVLIMGGPMGVYEQNEHPFIGRELAFIAQCRRMNARLFGVCLGAQMIAEALGGRVYRGHVQEIGWRTIIHTVAAACDPLFSVFPPSLDVFQWHQDTFDLPPDAVRLAGSQEYPNQAFRVGDRIYGLQYHIEATAAVLRDWFPGGDEETIDNRRLDALRPMAVEAFTRFLSL